MPQYGLQMSLDGQQHLIRTFETLGEAVKDFSPVWKEVIAGVKTDIEKRFDTQGADIGGWKPLSSEYVAWKARKGFHKQILMRTGLLKESLLKEGMGKGFNIERIEPVGFEFGTSVSYGFWHQKGTARGLPQRRILVMRPDDFKKIVSSMRRHVYKVTKVSAMPGR